MATSKSDLLAADTLSSIPAAESPVAEILRRIDERLADLILTGLMSCAAPHWDELHQVSRQLGFVRLTARLAALADALNSRANTLRWNADAASRIKRTLRANAVRARR